MKEVIIDFARYLWRRVNNKRKKKKKLCIKNPFVFIDMFIFIINSSYEIIEWNVGICCYQVFIVAIQNDEH